MEEAKLEIRNKTLALFMGAEKITTFYEKQKDGTKIYDHDLLDMCGKGREHEDSWHCNQRYWASTTLRYHKDWNELMRVMLKINKINKYTSAERAFNTLQEFYRRETKDWYALISTIEEYHLAAYMYIVKKDLFNRK